MKTVEAPVEAPKRGPVKLHKGCAVPRLVENAVVVGLCIFRGLGLFGRRPTHVELKQVVADVHEMLEGINLGEPCCWSDTSDREGSLGPEGGCVGRIGTMSPPP